MNRKQRTARNIVANLVNKGMVIVLGIVLPRLLIVSFGSEVNGLLSSVHNLFLYINLLEGGLSLATVQALYGPVARGDGAARDGILAAAGRSFRRVGVYVLACVVGVAAVYPLVVPSGIGYGTVVGVILLQGSVTVLDYFVQARYRVLLQAEAKSYVLFNFNTVFHLLTNAAKIVLVLSGAGVLWVQASFALLNLLKMLLFQAYVRRHYAHLDRGARPDFQALAGRRYAFVHNAIHVLSANVDILIVTLVLGLMDVSVYSVYYMIFTAVTMLIDAVMEGINAVFGQLYQHDRPRFLTLYHGYTVAYMMLSFVCFLVAFLLIRPFIGLYTRGITDVQYLVPGLPLVFTLGILLEKMAAPQVKVIQYAGHFRQTSRDALLVVLLNVALSLALSVPFGLLGVVGATILANLYKLLAFTRYVQKNLLPGGAPTPYGLWAVNVAAGVALGAAGVRLIPAAVSGYLPLTLLGLLALAVISLGIFAANMVFPPIRRRVRDALAVVRG